MPIQLPTLYHHHHHHHDYDGVDDDDGSDDDHPGDANPAARPIRRDRTRRVGDSRALAKWGAANWHHHDDDDEDDDTDLTCHHQMSWAGWGPPVLSLRCSLRDSQSQTQG